MKVKVLGVGCPNCNKLYEVVTRAAGTLNAGLDLEKVSDYSEIARYGVLQVPALVIDEQVVLVGKVPSVAEMARLLETALAEQTPG